MPLSGEPVLLVVVVEDLALPEVGEELAVAGVGTREGERGRVLVLRRHHHTMVWRRDPPGARTQSGSRKKPRRRSDGRGLSSPKMGGGGGASEPRGFSLSLT